MGLQGVHPGLQVDHFAQLRPQLEHRAGGPHLDRQRPTSSAQAASAPPPARSASTITGMLGRPAAGTRRGGATPTAWRRHPRSPRTPERSSAGPRSSAGGSRGHPRRCQEVPAIRQGFGPDSRTAGMPVRPSQRRTMMSRQRGRSRPTGQRVLHQALEQGDRLHGRVVGVRDRLVELQHDRLVAAAQSGVGRPVLPAGQTRFVPPVVVPAAEGEGVLHPHHALPHPPPGVHPSQAGRRATGRTRPPASARPPRRRTPSPGRPAVRLRRGRRWRSWIGRRCRRSRRRRTAERSWQRSGSGTPLFTRRW